MRGNDVGKWYKEKKEKRECKRVECNSTVIGKICGLFEEDTEADRVSM